MTYYSNWDAYYDDEGEYCGPKRWTYPDVTLEDDTYVLLHYKRDEVEYVELVYLDPAGDPDAAPLGEGYVTSAPL